MKFYCDKCRTKYSIAAEKVRGKILKVRCKKCGHIITVREAAAPAMAQRREVSPPPVRRGQMQWHYSINGQSFGPLGQGQLANKFARGELGDAVYVWNETFTEWKLVGDVPTFAPALARAARSSPPQRTLGISQPLAAVTKETLEQEGAAAPASVASVASTSADALREEVQEAPGEEGSAPRGDDPQKARQDRLAALRARLRIQPEPEAKPQEEVSQETLGQPFEEEDVDDDATELMESPFLGDLLPKEPIADAEERLEVEEPVEETEEAHEEEREPISFEFDLGLAETLPSSELTRDEPEEGHEEEELSAEVDGANVYDGLFSGLSDDLDDEEDLLADSEELESAEEGDSIPFFPSAPKLAGEMQATTMGRSDEVTGSLLIQLNAIKSDGRKRAIATSIVAALVLGLVGTIVYVGMTREKEEVVEEQGPRLRMDNVGKAPQFREYTEEERKRGLGEIFLEQELVISREDSKAAYEEEERRKKGGRPSADEGGAALPSVPKIDPAAYRTAEGELDGMQASRDQEAGVQSRFQRGGAAGLAGSGPGGGPSLKGLAGSGDDDFDDDRFRAMAAVQTDSQRGVYNPRDEFDELTAPREALSGQDIARGMQNVMASVGSCRERHIMRGGTLTQDSVEVTLDIMPNGRVEALNLAPAALNETDFGRCMNSHIRRWRFPPFQGETTRVRTPFLLQD